MTDFRQHYRQVFFWYWYDAALFTVNDRDRLTPVSLARKYPVFNFVIILPNTVYFFNDLIFINKITINDREVKFLSEIKITFVVCWYVCAMSW